MTQREIPIQTRAEELARVRVTVLEGEPYHLGTIQGNPQANPLRWYSREQAGRRRDEETKRYGTRREQKDFESQWGEIKMLEESRRKSEEYLKTVQKLVGNIEKLLRDVYSQNPEKVGRATLELRYLGLSNFYKQITSR